MADSTRENGTSEILRSPELLSAENSRLLIVDVQEKLLPLIPVAERLVHNCRRLLDGAKILSIPAFGTEQYPQGLGRTTSELAERLGPMPGKVCFSCVPVLEWGEAAELTDDRDQVIVAGMETHVCVLQTVLDLLAGGFRVHVPADAVASRSELDWRDRPGSDGVLGSDGDDRRIGPVRVVPAGRHAGIQTDSKVDHRRITAASVRKA